MTLYFPCAFTCSLMSSFHFSLAADYTAHLRAIYLPSSSVPQRLTAVLTLLLSFGNACRKWIYSSLFSLSLTCLHAACPLSSNLQQLQASLCLHPSRSLLSASLNQLPHYFLYLHSLLNFFINASLATVSESVWIWI